jgi:hypothetical protein
MPRNPYRERKSGPPVPDVAPLVWLVWSLGSKGMALEGVYSNRVLACQRVAELRKQGLPGELESRELDRGA